MTLLSLLILLLIAGVCGAIGQAITGYYRGGILVSIAIGFVGALLGAWLSSVFGVRDVFAVRIGGETFPVIWAIIGSTLFVAIVGLLTSRRHRRLV